MAIGLYIHTYVHMYIATVTVPITCSIAVCQKMDVRTYVCMQVYIASCEDLQIRVYCPNFSVLQGVPMPSSALCLLYLEEWDELLVGGVGQLHTWAFHPRQKNMLTKTAGFTTTIKPQQVRYCLNHQYTCLYDTLYIGTRTYIRMYVCTLQYTKSSTLRMHAEMCTDCNGCVCMRWN